MLPRERVRRAIHREYPDMMPVEVHSSPGGLHEHGEKLRDLIRGFPNDFGDLSGVEVRHPGPGQLDPDGRYHEIRIDGWGVEWEHTLYGAWGIPRTRPLDDLANLATFAAPPVPPCSGPEFEADRRRAEEFRTRYYHFAGGGDILETMRFLRRHEDVLCDIHDDTDEINAIADIVVAHDERNVARALALGADGIALADDFGTQQTLILGLPVWRRFFRPRYDRLMAPIRAAGKDIHFHSCGQIRDILPDLAELGVTSIWPQLPLWAPVELEKTCRSLGLAISLHVDRAHLMSFGSPDAVRRTVAEWAAAFRRPEGGAWWYIEIECGMPWKNVVALFESVARERIFP